VCFDGEWYTSVEHAYQAAKTLVHSERRDICLAPTPGKAKRLGKKVTLRPDWEAVKLQVMDAMLRQKFRRGSEMAEKLRATGDQLIVEGNRWHDNFWGICACPSCVNRDGYNHLGNLLMKIRKEL
jgi:ribA/ribD-fused uncharacterized protein